MILYMYSDLEENKLDLTITTLPGEFKYICSHNKLSNHVTIKGHLKVWFQNRQNKTKRYQQYSKGNYNKEREGTGTFACDKWFIGHQNALILGENLMMIEKFILDTVQRNTIPKTSRRMYPILWIRNKIRCMIKMRNKRRQNYKKVNRIHMVTMVTEKWK